MNDLRNTFTMARKDLKVLLRDRGQLIVLFALPLLLSVIIGLFWTTMVGASHPGGETKLEIKAYVVVEDQGPYGAQVESVLGQIPPLRLSRLRSAEMADQKVAEGEAAAAIIIPADFSAKIDANQPVTVRLIKDPTHQVQAQTVAQILNEALTELSIRAEVEYGIRSVFQETGVLEGVAPEVARAAHAQMMGTVWTAVQEIRQNPAIAVQREDLSGEEVEVPVSGLVFTAFVPMFATMFAFFLVGFMAESIVGEKLSGSFRRISAAPVHRSSVIGGKMLAFVGVVFMQMLVLFGAGHVFFDMPLGDSPLGLLVVTLALSFASTGLGMLVGTIARSRKQAGAIGMVLAFVLFAAAGFTSTLSISSEGAAMNLEGFSLYLSKLTPHAYAYNGYLKVMLEGAGPAEILPNMLVLLGFGLVFFLIGVWRFRYE